MWPVIVDLVAAAVAGGLVVLLVRRSPRASSRPRSSPPPSAPRLAVTVGWRRCWRSRVDPQATTGLTLTVAAIVVVGAVGVGLLLFMVRRNLGFAEWDLSTARFGTQRATSRR